MAGEAADSPKLLGKMLSAGRASLTMEHLGRRDLQMLLSAREASTDGTKAVLMSRLQGLMEASLDSRWSVVPCVGQGPKRNGSSVFTYNGQLYLVGGESSRESSNDEVLMKYNDATARFEGVPLVLDDDDDEDEDDPAAQCNQCPPTALYCPTTVIYDNRLWVFWGSHGDDRATYNANIYIHDFSTGLWECLDPESDQKGAVPESRSRASAVVHEGKVIFCGFEDDMNDREDSRTIIVFDLATRTWSKMHTSGTCPAHQKYVAALTLRDAHTAVALVQPHDQPGADFLIYKLDIQKRKWTKGTGSSKSPPATCEFVVVPFGDEWIFHGGYKRSDPNDVDSWDNVQPTNEVYAYNFEESKWRQVEVEGMLPRGQHAAVVMHDSILFVGGEATLERVHEADEDEDEDEAARVDVLWALQIRYDQPSEEEEKKSIANFELLGHLRVFYKNELHSDVTLVAGGVKINAHRVVLSAQSPTFKTMFNAGMRESQEREVVLEEISGKVLEVLVSYFYGVHQDIDQALIHDLFRAADRFQVDNLRGELLEIMINCIDVHNVAAFIKLADDFRIDRLEAACVEFAQDPANHRLVIGGEKFLNLMKESTDLAQRFLLGCCGALPTTSARASASRPTKRRRVR